MKNKEYKSRCDKCGKRRRSRIFWRKIEDAWKHLCSKCWDEVQGHKPTAINYQEFNVMAERCGECLFSNDALVTPESRAAIIEECREHNSYFICHQATEQGGLKVCCNGFFNSQETLPVALAKATNNVRLIQRAELPLLNPTGQITVTADIAFLREMKGKMD